MSKEKPVLRKDRDAQPGSIFGNQSEFTNVTAFDWGSVDAARIGGLVVLVSGRGGAIRFGYSRDGSAGSVGLYHGERRDTLYVRPNQDPEEVLGLIERTFEALPYTGGKSPSQ